MLFIIRGVLSEIGNKKGGAYKINERKINNRLKYIFDPLKMFYQNLLMPDRSVTL